jgi:hypothetical protein
MFLNRIVPIFGGTFIILVGLFLLRLPVLGMIKILLPILILIFGAYFLYAAIMRNRL